MRPPLSTNLRIGIFIIILSAFLPRGSAEISQSYGSPESVENIRINEFLAANANGLLDEDGDAEDWVELFNASSSTINLEGWSLTDDVNLTAKWTFPAVNLAPQEYLVVFCSGKDRRPAQPGSEYHTNFRLNSDGESVSLFDNQVPGQIISSYNPFPTQRNDVSFGFDPEEALRYFLNPTPGSANGSSEVAGIVADTKFSHDRGFYETNFSLVISTVTTGAVIRLTLDGTPPSLTNGMDYSSPIEITNTSVIRATAFKEGLLETDVDTQTYIFIEDVIQQSPNGQAPPGWPTQWGDNTVNYGMDPTIVDHFKYSQTIRDDLKSIPTFSIVMDLDDLFDASKGIYANAFFHGIEWERPCSMELIHPDGRDGFHINAGIRIRGGIGREPENPKHAFRFLFRNEYDAARLNYPLFGEDGANTHDRFDLRVDTAAGWARSGNVRETFIRDLFARDLQLASGQPATRGDFYFLYINGQFWGIYASQERSDAAWVKTYFGGEEEDYDVIKVENPDRGPNWIVARDGDIQAWFQLWQAATNGFSLNEDYFAIQGLNGDGSRNPGLENLLDVPNLIDYMLNIIYTGNQDAPITFNTINAVNNWWGFRRRDGQQGGFKFLVHDAEIILINAFVDRTITITAGDPTAGGDFTNSNPQYVWQRLQDNEEFRIKVADHVQRHFFNDGVYTPSFTRARWQARRDEVYQAVVAESARWGDSKVEPPRERDIHWVTEMDSTFGSLLERTDIVLDQLRNRDLYPNHSAPILNLYGGTISAGFQLLMTNENVMGTIVYTLDGTDPRMIGGDLLPGAISYDGPIVINARAHLKSRVLLNSEWSALTEAVFYTDQDFSGLHVTEIMYHPPDQPSVNGSEFEFLELKNTGTNRLDLSGLFFSNGITFTFTNGTWIEPGEFFVLGRNPTQFAAQYTGVALHGAYSGKLNNEGERITLSHPGGTKVLSVDYNNGGRWPVTPNGHGFTLVPALASSSMDPDNPRSWRASSAVGGSPRADDPEPGGPGVVINEILTHTDPPAVDSIELYNSADEEVDLSSWFLTDDGEVPLKFRIPDGTMISATGHLVFTESDFNPTPGTHPSFTLSSLGEEVYLVMGDGAGQLSGYSHGFNFGAAANGISLGRHVISTGDEHFPAQADITLGEQNAGPLVGPVVISQIHYHPLDFPGEVDNKFDEFIVLRNITDAPVAMFDLAFPDNTWQMRDAIDFVFPPNTSLTADASLLVVSFNPQDAQLQRAFLDKYPLLAGLPMHGPFSGKLSNADDRVELVRPDTPNLGLVPEILVDRVHYHDSGPWPLEADGLGGVLQRVSLHDYGNDPVNWVSVIPLTIFSLSQDHTVRPGAMVSFNIHVAGSGMLQFQWQFKEMDIPGATNSSITLSNVMVSQEGDYRVSVTDANSTFVSPPVFLRVLVDPFVVQDPLSQSVVEGGNVTLSIESSGSLPMGYRWRFGATTLTNMVHNSHTAFYTINNVSTAHAGRYSVVLTNEAFFLPGRLSQAATLTVLADRDSDGLPDDWEMAHGLNLNEASDAFQDLDGDGMTNLEEYEAGTDPQDDQSYLKIEEINHSGGGTGVSLNFLAASNKTYSVVYQSEAGEGMWVKLTDVTAFPSNRIVEVTNSFGGNSQRYYRLVTPR